MLSKHKFQIACVLCELEGLLGRQFDRKSLLSGNENVAIPVEASMPPNYFITTGFFSVTTT